MRAQGWSGEVPAGLGTVLPSMPAKTPGAPYTPPLVTVTLYGFLQENTQNSADGLRSLRTYKSASPG